MRGFFSPRSIAVVGASANPQKGGNAITRNLIEGFQGSIYPVNPNHPQIENLRCYPRVSQIHGPVDLAVVFVPVAAVPDVLLDCGAAGVKRIMLLSGGFAETGPEGRVLQDECLAIARHHGMRLWGPNCMGLMDATNGFICSFMTPEMWMGRLVPGKVSLITQSGTLAGAIPIDFMTHGIMGIAKACSIGNKIDVNECDLLDYLLEDPDTGVIALFLESLSDGRRLMDIAEHASKPIVVLNGGRSEQGARAALGHTASLSGDDRILRAALTQSGVLLANDFSEMMDISRALAAIPGGMASSKAAVLTFSGGAGVVAADLLAGHGIELPRLSASTLSRLSDLFPPWAKASNPIDLWPLVEKIGGTSAYVQCARIAAQDTNVDALLLLTVAGGFDLDLDLDALASVAQSEHIPIVFSVIGPRDAVDAFQRKAREHGMVAFREIARAVDAIDALSASAPIGDLANVATQGGHPGPDEKAPEPPARQSPIRRVLDEYESKQLLQGAGIPTIAEEIAGDPDDALRVAEHLGFPVVLKGLLPGEIHKTEKGLVRLDIRTAGELIDAFEELRLAMDGAGRILVQRFAHVEHELICGMVRDHDFGPTVMFGLGGVMAEVYQDVVFRVAPLRPSGALAMIHGIRASEVMSGFRGGRPVDYDRLSEILVALGRIGVDSPQVAQIDINPLAITGGRLVALDATVVLDEV